MDGEKLKVKVHTGPGRMVSFISEKLKEAGYEVSIHGTEHVYFLVEKVRDYDANFLLNMRSVHGTSYNLRLQAV